MRTILVAIAGIGIQEIIALILLIAFVVLIFVVFRAFVLWYWKVDTIIENQQRQIELLQNLFWKDTPATNQYTRKNVDEEIREKARKYDQLQNEKISPQ